MSGLDDWLEGLGPFFGDAFLALAIAAGVLLVLIGSARIFSMSDPPNDLPSGRALDQRRAARARSRSGTGSPT